MRTMVRRSAAAFVAAIAAIAIAAPAFAQQDLPQLLVEPTMGSNLTTLRDSCLNPTQWPTGWSRANIVGGAILTWNTMTNAEISACFTNLRNSGKSVNLWLASLKEPGNCTTAVACWNANAAIVARLASLNPPHMIFSIDEPLTGSQSYASYATAVSETANWIKLARQNYPGVDIILAEAYPHWSASTLSSFFTDVNTQAKTLTGKGIQYAALDQDWNAGGSFADMLNIRSTVKNAGVGFEFFFWNASQTMTWQQGLMYQGEQWVNQRQNGALPDLYAISNWTLSPTTANPESTAGTFTRSVRDFVLRYLPKASMASNTVLNMNQAVVSADGRFQLQYQNDGNLVLVNNTTHSPMWSSNTPGRSVGRVIMQGDGNLVIYDANNTAIWSSGTYNHNGSFLVVQSDGNLVIYSNIYNVPLWATNTSCC